MDIFDAKYPGHYKFRKSSEQISYGSNEWPLDTCIKTHFDQLKPLHLKHDEFEMVVNCCKTKILKEIGNSMEFARLVG